MFIENIFLHFLHIGTIYVYYTFIHILHNLRKICSKIFYTRFFLGFFPSLVKSKMFIFRILNVHSLEDIFNFNTFDKSSAIQFVWLKIWNRKNNLNDKFLLNFNTIVFKVVLYGILHSFGINYSSSIFIHYSILPV